MSLFLLFFTTAYSLIHFTVFLRLKALLSWRGPGFKFLIAWSVLMLLLPIAVSALSRRGFSTLAGILSWPAYLWLGFVCLLFVAGLLSWPVQWLLGWAKAVFLPSLRLNLPRLMASLAVAAALVGMLHGLLEAANIRTEQVVMATDKLPPGIRRIRLALTSDLHLGRTSRLANLKKVVDIIKTGKADLWLDVGDMVDSSLSPNGSAAKLLDSVNPPLGKYVVPGNHERYAGSPNAMRFFKAAGFMPLINQGRMVHGVLNLAGVSDLPREEQDIKTLDALRAVQNGLFTIVLKHRPLVSQGSAALMDLQLSGHTHGGQVWPFNYVVGRIYPYLEGMYPLDHGAHIYTSRGAGYWGPPIRIFAPPAVVIIDLINSAGAKAPPRAADEGAARSGG